MATAKAKEKEKYEKRDALGGQGAALFHCKKYAFLQKLLKVNCGFAEEEGAEFIAIYSEYVKNASCEKVAFRRAEFTYYL